jgi:carboxylesterase
MTKQPLGVLILHGFTGSLDTVKALVPIAEKLGLPYRMPVLRGHGTRYEDLSGVTANDWYVDAQAAMAELLKEAEQVIVIGLSMGALLTLNLAMDHAKDVAGVVLIAAFLRCANPLAHITPLLTLFFPYWDNPASFDEKAIGAPCTNYKRFPTATFSSLLNYAGDMERRLNEVKAPALIIHSHRDHTASSITPLILQEKLGSIDTRMLWFDRSGHEMLQDREAPAVIEAIGAYLKELALRHTPALKGTGA